MNKKFSSFLLLLLLIPSVLSLGVTPARTTIDFSPGLEETISITVLNSEEKDISLSIFTRGELAEYISLETTSASFSPTETSKELQYTLSLPSDLSPGLHTAEVVVLEEATSEEGGKAHLGTSVGVATQLHVFVPYPGAFIDAELNVIGPEDDKTLLIGIVNRGTESIQTLSAKITIFDSNGEEITTLDTNSISLSAGDRGELQTSWKPTVGQGKYIAKAVLSFDGAQQLTETEFTVGELVLDLKQIIVENFELGTIAEFEMVVENKWNEALNGAYAEMRVFDDSFNEIATATSATYDIPPQTQTTMVYYWDTLDILADTYNANIILYYAGKKVQQDLELVVNQDSIDVVGVGYVISSTDSTGTSNGLVVILGTIIGVLILMNLLWFLVLRKKLHKK